MSPAEIRQVLVNGPGDVVLARVPRAELAPDEVRIGVSFAGICGSELHHVFNTDGYGVVPPTAFGHEYSGVVSEVGERVERVAAGTRVTCVPRIPCLRCASCRVGRLTNCRDQRRPARGAWADEIVVHERFVYELPADVSLREAALCEPLACALRGVDRAAAPPGHVALVVGGGPIGLMTAVLARHAGAAEVLLSEPNETRRRLAEQLGATVVDPRTQDLADAVDAATSGRGVEVAYEAVGRPESVSEAVELVGPGGTLVVLGVAPPSAVAPIRPWRLFERELTIVAAWGHETTFLRALEWLPKLGLDALVTHELPLDEIGRALEIAASADCGKVLLTPSERSGDAAAQGR